MPKSMQQFFALGSSRARLNFIGTFEALKTRFIYTCIYHTVVCNCLISVQMCVCVYMWQHVLRHVENFPTHPQTYLRFLATFILFLLPLFLRSSLLCCLALSLSECRV